MTAATRTGADGLLRCWWPGDDAGYLTYHDREWGRPVTDDCRLFEKLCLEGFQSGLSWLTILRKRDNFRAAFCGFDIASVAAFGPADTERLLGDAGIVRHRGKIGAAINNARRASEIVEEFGSLAAYYWSWEPQTASYPPTGKRRTPRVDSGVGGLGRGPQAARLPLRRSHHGVRVHAGDGPGERPHRRLLRPHGVRGRAHRPDPPSTQRLNWQHLHGMCAFCCQFSRAGVPR